MLGVFSYITNERQRYTVYLFLWNALHVSGRSSAHHQELKTVSTASGYFVKLSLLPATVGSNSSTTVAGSSESFDKVPRCCIYSFWAPDDGRRNRLKPVEHFTEINKLCNVAFCRLYLEIWTHIYWYRYTKQVDEKHSISYPYFVNKKCEDVPVEGRNIFYRKLTVITHYSLC